MHCIPVCICTVHITITATAARQTTLQNALYVCCTRTVRMYVHMTDAHTSELKTANNVNQYDQEGS
jgi:hypothetical protein